MFNINSVVNVGRVVLKSYAIVAATEFAIDGARYVGNSAADKYNELAEKRAIRLMEKEIAEEAAFDASIEASRKRSKRRSKVVAAA